MKHTSFAADLRWSRGRIEQRDMDTLRALFGPSCVSVEKTAIDEDRAGVDYVVTLRRGATVHVDAKARKPGASRYWRYGEPDLQLESYSVLPMPDLPKGKPGWVLDESRNVDLFLFTYDADDTTDVYVIPSQLLRMAFRRNYNAWRREYDVFVQSSGSWRSECFFVPKSIVAAAVSDVQWNGLLPVGNRFTTLTAS